MISCDNNVSLASSSPYSSIFITTTVNLRLIMCATVR
jgi:hypothetical protein